MCKVLKEKVHVHVYMRGVLIGVGNIVGTANISAMFKDGSVVDVSEEEYTAQQCDDFARIGAYPGTALNQNVIVMDDAAHTVLYGCQVHVVVLTNAEKVQ